MTRTPYDVLADLRQRERDVDDLRAELARVLEQPQSGLNRLARDLARNPRARRLTPEAIEEAVTAGYRTPDDPSPVGEIGIDPQRPIEPYVDEHAEHLELIDSQIAKLEALVAVGDGWSSESMIGFVDAWRRSWSPTTTELVHRVAKLEAITAEAVEDLEVHDEQLDQRVDSSLELRRRVEALERRPGENLEERLASLEALVGSFDTAGRLEVLEVAVRSLKEWRALSASKRDAIEPQQGPAS